MSGRHVFNNSARDACRQIAVRVAREGVDTLETETLLALLAGGSSRRTARGLEQACHRLLANARGLRGVCGMTPAEIARSSALPKDGACTIAAAMELAKRWAAERRSVGRAFSTPADFFEHYKLKLRDLKKEVFVVVHLDRKNRFLGDEFCSTGSLTGTIVHPREVLRGAIRSAAASFAVVHNHPSGDPTPSLDDVNITVRLARAGTSTGIPLLDHVIIGGESYRSLLYGLEPPCAALAQIKELPRKGRRLDGYMGYWH